jgi:hypothetical protein
MRTRLWWCRTGGEYVVGTVLDDWFMVPADAVRRFLAKLLNAREEERFRWSVDMELWQYYREAWEAERALKPRCRRRGLWRAGVAFAVVKISAGA